MRLLRRPLACSWRSLSTCNTRQQLRSFYIAERAARARAFGCHCSYFRSRLASLFRDAFVSAGALHLVCRHSASRLCRRSALSLSLLSSLVLSLVSALLSAGVLLPSLPALRFVSAPLVSSLPRLRLSLVA